METYLSVTGDLELLLRQRRLLRVRVHVPPRRDVLEADEVSVSHQLDLHALVHLLLVEEVEFGPSFGVPPFHQEPIVLVLVGVCRYLPQNEGFFKNFILHLYSLENIPWRKISITRIRFIYPCSLAFMEPTMRQSSAGFK